MAKLDGKVEDRETPLDWLHAGILAGKEALAVIYGSAKTKKSALLMEMPLLGGKENSGQDENS